jgi:hypothetical protein
MENIVLRPVERLAGLIAEILRINGVLGQICTKALLGYDGALQIVVTVDSHCIGGH